MTVRCIDVLATGPLTLIQDCGRIGRMAVGVGRAGAADRAAYELGARLVANPPGLPALEVTFGGLAVRARGSVLVCVTGAPAQATVDGRQMGHAAPFHLPHGSELRLGTPMSGLRSYVSFRGGLVVDPTLGSCSTDTMSGLGPGPLAPGDILTVGASPRDQPNVDVAPVPLLSNDPLRVRVTPGPRHDWFAEPARLAAEIWSVSDRSDRRGVRLIGAPLQRHDDFVDRELPSEGMVRGAIQVPPDGRPVVFLNDHPVTGGYPVIGVVRTADIDRVAQLTPGQRLTVRWEPR